MRDLLWGIGARIASLLRRIGLGASIMERLYEIGVWLFPLPEKDLRISLSLGLTLIAPAGAKPRGSIRTMKQGLYERELTGFFLRSIKTGMRAVDAGAHIGYHTLLLGKLVGETGKVYAFEPDAGNFKYLLRNIRENHLTNIVATPEALSDKIGTAVFTHSPLLKEGSLRPYALAGGPASFSVSTTSLDEFFRHKQWESLGLIKLDIDGGEFLALKGMDELCRRNPDLYLVMEFSASAMEQSGVDPIQMIAVLRELGFHEARIIEQDYRTFPLDTNSLPRNLVQKGAHYNLLLNRKESKG